MLEQLELSFKKRESFALETTLSGRGYQKSIAKWQAAGYRVTLIFLKLTSVQEAVARVSQRVLQGGHDIPAQVIARRFASGFSNFEDIYKPMVDAWAVYDNSGLEPVLLDWGEK
jgi:predicted ABC-type ATPase